MSIADATRALTLGVLMLFSCFTSPVGAKTEASDSLAKTFGTIASLWNVRLSQDGSKISFLQMHPKDYPVLRVFDIANREIKPVLSSVPNKFDIAWCSWANRDRLLCGFHGIAKSLGRRYVVTRLVAVDADGSQMKVLLQRKLEGTFAQFQDQIVDWLVDDPDQVLIQMPSAGGSGVEALNIYSGRTRRVSHERKDVRYWISDGHGTPRLRQRVTLERSKWYFRAANDDKWRPLREAKTTEVDDTYSPVGFGDDRNKLLVFKPHQGRLALWSEDLANNRKSELVYAHPEVDLDGLVSLGKYRRLVAVSYQTDKPHLHFFDQRIQAVGDRIRGPFPGKTVTVIDESWDQRYYLANVSSDRDPGTFYRFDAEKSQLDKIASSHPLLQGRELAAMTPIQYEATDGTAIPGYVTLPPERSEGPLPTVILPHGGPESRDGWSFNWLAQFLAARGFAVLQSNFRGSGGYGNLWAGAGGFRGWRLAVSDLSDGAQDLVERGIADPDRVCIVGWSYGGYAALMSAIEEPERYRCVVSIAGVTDPGMLIHDGRDFLSARRLETFVGTADEVRDDGSPLKRAGEILAPVLLFHGEDDVNVSVGHSKALHKAMRQKKKSVEFVEYEGAAHSIERNRHRVDMLVRLGAFLDAHLRPPAKTPRQGE